MLPLRETTEASYQVIEHRPAHLGQVLQPNGILGGPHVDLSIIYPLGSPFFLVFSQQCCVGGCAGLAGWSRVVWKGHSVSFSPTPRSRFEIGQMDGSFRSFAYVYLVFRCSWVLLMLVAKGCIILRVEYILHRSTGAVVEESKSGIWWSYFLFHGPT